jgi:uncharacterized SAM-binding protein YcdF (DUF218 family)
MPIETTLGSKRKNRLRGWAKRAGIISVLLLLLWLVRFPILRSIGNALIHEDALTRADAVYVLGGSPLERAAEGARLVIGGYAPLAVFTGSPVHELLSEFGVDSCEAGLGASIALRSGLPAERTLILRVGTSTKEEAEAIRAHATSIGADTVIVVSTEFHTQRVSRVMRKAMKGTGITVVVRAVRSQRYDADQWWASEEGMIMVSNECMKHLYYAIKH